MLIQRASVKSFKRLRIMGKFTYRKKAIFRLGVPCFVFLCKKKENTELYVVKSCFTWENRLPFTAYFMSTADKYVNHFSNLVIKM